MALILPTQKSEKNLKWEAQKFLMIGQGGIGKSEFWAQGEKTLFIECEPGLNFLEVIKTPVRCWNDFIELGTALHVANAAGTFPYDTIVIDTADKWIDKATEEVISRGRAKYDKIEINSIGDIPNGAGWYWATDLIDTYLDKLSRFPCAVVLIGHVDNKKVKTQTAEYDRMSITIGGKMGTGLLHWADHTMHIQTVQQASTMRRIVRTKPTQSIEAKSRGGIIPDGWEWGDDMAKNYQKLRKLFL